MKGRELAATIARAMRAIDEDDPAFALCLEHVAEQVLPELAAPEDSTAAAVLTRNLTALFLAVRKLRPCPIWVEGPLEVALATRDAYALDGVLVRGPAERLPAQRGREAYWAVSAQDSVAHWAHVPAGFGVVVATPAPALMPPARIAEARAVLRGRSLGILADVADAEGFRDAGLDLLVLEASTPTGIAALRELAPRVMYRARGPVRTSEVGVIVPVAAAASSALFLAGHRRARPVGHAG